MPAPKRSKIGYCDYSGGDLNFVLGCTPVSTGCTNCYARRIYERFGKDFSIVRSYPSKLRRLKRWLLEKRPPPYKRGPGSRPLAFVVDMGDLFHEEVPTSIIRQFLYLAANRPHIDWLVLTKRPERMRIALTGAYSLAQFIWRAPPFPPLPNLWLGVTVEDQDYLWRIDELLKTPAAVRWVSLEPMLGPIDLRPWTMDGIGHDHHPKYKRYEYGTGAIQWVMVGAESGPNRRPFKREWAWDVLDQCREAGVPCFLKQASGARPGVPLLDREGREVKEWPKT